MKKSLFVLGTALLFTTSAFAGNWDYAQGSPTYGTYQQPVVQSASAKTTKTSLVRKKSADKKTATSGYRIGNPLYHPTAGQTLLTGTASYYYIPREEAIGQEKTTGWTADPVAEIGLSNQLSTYFGADYGQFKTKGGVKFSTYNAAIGLRYLLASVDGFDFNLKAGLYYDKGRLKNVRTTYRETGTDLGLQIGKKIQNLTPYFGVGFKTDFWSKRGSSSGTDTYINPGVYIDLSKAVSLNLGYSSIIHSDAEYRAMFDIYAARNTMFTLGAFVIHPETDKDTYGATAGMKVGF